MAGGSTWGDALTDSWTDAAMGASSGGIGAAIGTYKDYVNKDVSPWTGKPNFDKLPQDSNQNGSQKMTLPSGFRVDRYGNDEGKYLSPQGTPFNMRGLPLAYQYRPYQIYEVAIPFEVEYGSCAPGFGSIGGGDQIRFSKPIDFYLKNGSLIKP
jgi:hypothetical protein